MCDCALGDFGIVPKRRKEKCRWIRERKKSWLGFSRAVCESVGREEGRRKKRAVFVFVGPALGDEIRLINKRG